MRSGIVNQAGMNEILTIGAVGYPCVCKGAFGPGSVGTGGGSIPVRARGAFCYAWLLYVKFRVYSIRKLFKGVLLVADRVRHKVFLSYHHDDQKELDKFIRTFDHERDVFIARAVGSDETMDRLIDSGNPDYVMRCIRQGALSDSTVTAAFIGSKTWTRKYVDWELAASLHQGPVARKPNGLLAILSPKLSGAILPDRFKDNLETGYAKFYPYPNGREQLFRWIEEAFMAREDDEMCRRVRNGSVKLKRNLHEHNDRAGRSEVGFYCCGSCEQMLKYKESFCPGCWRDLKWQGV